MKVIQAVSHELRMQARVLINRGATAGLRAPSPNHFGLAATLVLCAFALAMGAGCAAFHRTLSAKSWTETATEAPPQVPLGGWPQEDPSFLP